MNLVAKFSNIDLWTKSLVLAVLLLLFGLCANVAYSEFLWLSKCLFGRGLCVRLFVDGQPRVGNLARLRVEIDSRGSNSPSAEVKVDLPNSIELVEGNLIWEESFAASKRASRSLTISVKESGEWKINVSAYSNYYGAFGSSTIYIRSSATTGEASDQGLPNKWFPPATGMGVPVAQIDERFRGSMTFSSQPQLGEQVTVTYVVSNSIPVQDVSMDLVYPPLGFQVIDVEFPQGAINTYKWKSQFTWIGNLESVGSKSIMATFRIVDIGEGEIGGLLWLRRSGVQTAQARAYLKVNQFVGILNFITPTYVTPTRRP